MEKVLEKIRKLLSDTDVTEKEMKKIAEQTVYYIDQYGYDPKQLEEVPDVIWEWAFNQAIEDTL